MKKFLVCALAMFCATATCMAANFTADRHVARGINCQMCHVKADKSIPVRQQQCLTCHGQNYAAMAEKTKDIKPNPHYNHYGDRDCSTCHKGHQASVLTCNTCHQFDLKTP